MTISTIFRYFSRLFTRLSAVDLYSLSCSRNCINAIIDNRSRAIPRLVAI